jgi:SAM-dependent methyltransferase
MTELAHNKVIDIQDFDNPVLAPFLQYIAYDEMVRFGLETAPNIPDSKQWECAMMLRSFDQYGLLRPGALMAGIGAGTEQTTFALASRGCITFPIDRYLEVTPWSDVAPAPMMVRPRQYTNFKYQRGHVIPVHSDARIVELPSSFFDGVYSAGSIEHFGSLEAVAAAAEEIGRILKPGGIAALSTEFRLEGPNDRGWFDDNCILFTPELLHKYIIEPSGLEPLDPLIGEPSESTYDSRVVLLDFLAKATKVRSIEDKINAYPNLVLYHEGFLFCSVHLALRKPEHGVMPRARHHSEGFEKVVQQEAAAASGALTSQIEQWRLKFGRDDDELAVSTRRIEALEDEIAELRARNARLVAVEMALGSLLGEPGGGIVAGLAAQHGRPAPRIEWRLLNERLAGQIATFIGEENEGRLHSGGRAGPLCFGPYVDLEPGHYAVDFVLSAHPPAIGSFTVDAVMDGASEILAQRSVEVGSLPEPTAPDAPTRLEFSLASPARGVEFRVFVGAESDIIVKAIRYFARQVVLGP